MLVWFRSKPPVGGVLGGSGLGEWWQRSFTEDQRARIRAQVDQPFSIWSNLDAGPLETWPSGAKVYLVNLACWFQIDGVRDIGREIMDKAESLLPPVCGVLDSHFMLSNMIQFYHRCRKDHPRYPGLCVDRCRDMIAISKQAAAALRAQWPNSELPAHYGYGRLSWLLRKSDPAESARLRSEGEDQGWGVSI